ncbi:MAG: hypothetical protein JNK58_07020 [Phycisphaerae bacterium]|nr:hypothetical protein [Phycisphaerae bacterium]
MSQTAARTPTPLPAELSAKDAAPLEKRIEELLGEINQASRSVAEILGEEVHQTQRAESTPEDAGDPPPPPALAADPELESSIDQVIQDTRQTLEEPTEISPPSATIAQIDEALEQRADEVMAEATATGPGHQSPEVETAPLPATGEDQSTGDESESIPQDEKLSVNPVVPVVISAPPEPLGTPIEDQMVNGQPAHALSDERNRQHHQFRLISALAWPMANIPVGLRDLVGWFALVTIFNSACIWLYLLL